MNLSEYKKQALQFVQYENDTIGMACSALGIAGEVGEFCTEYYTEANIKNVISEAGDIMWKFMAIEKYYQIDFLSELSILPNNGHITEKTLQKKVLRIAETCKKIIRDPESTETEKRKSYLRAQCINLLCDIHYLTHELCGIKLETILQANIDKLTDRKNKNQIYR